MDHAKIESGVQLFSRLMQRTSIKNLHPMLFPEGPLPGEIIEIIGAAMTGKTLLITDFIARCILPGQHLGRDCGVVLINTDHHFDMLKLIAIMEVIIKDTSVGLDINIENIIKSSLHNLIILNCYDYQQMQLTFLNLAKILFDKTNVGLVVLDSLSTYYWEYRISKGIISYLKYHSKVLESLKSSVHNLHVVLVFTRSEFERPHEKGVHASNVSYTIALKRADENYAAVINNVHNVSNVFMYKIGDTIKFLV